MKQKAYWDYRVNNIGSVKGFFVCRYDTSEYHTNRRGELIVFRTRAGAKRKAAQLNKSEGLKGREVRI